MQAQLLFRCMQGEVDLERPVKLLRKEEVVELYEAPLTPLVQDQLAKARAAWEEAGHPGWSIVLDDQPSISTATNSSSHAGAGMGGLPVLNDNGLQQRSNSAGSGLGIDQVGMSSLAVSRPAAQGYGEGQGRQRPRGAYEASLQTSACKRITEGQQEGAAQKRRNCSP